MELVLQNICSASFSKSLTHEYRLSLIVGVNGISYMIVDGMDKVLVFKRFSIKGKDKINGIKAVLSQDEKLLFNYKSTKIGIESHTFTLIPERLFQAENGALYLNKTSRLGDKHHINNDHLSFNTSKLVYSQDAEMIAVLKNYFPSGQMFHEVTSLLNGWRKQSEVKEGKKIYVDINSDYFTIAFFDGDTLIFINRFQYQTAGDFLYYTLMTYDRFELKPETTPCIVSGFVMDQSEIYKKLYSYIRHLQFLPTSSYYTFTKEFEALPHHHYFDLYSLKLCES